MVNRDTLRQVQAARVYARSLEGSKDLKKLEFGERVVQFARRNRENSCALAKRMGVEIPLEAEALLEDSPPQVESFGNILARLRHDRSLSQEDLSTYADRSRVGLSNLETGRSAPRPQTVTNLIEALGLHEDSFDAYLLQLSAEQSRKKAFEMRTRGKSVRRQP